MYNIEHLNKLYIEFGNLFLVENVGLNIILWTFNLPVK